MQKKGFTIIELLIIVAILAILFSIILVSIGVKSQDKAAVNSYRTLMVNIQTALELCKGTGGEITSGSPGQSVCIGGDEEYPKISDKCNSGIQPYFYVETLGGNNWTITTTTDSSGATSWDCRGCRISCNVEGCEYIENEPGDCFNN